MHFIVATAGHVDHGKSALVRALTGTDPDRLPEEKARGITIDLGFAHLTLPAPGGAPGEPFDLGIVDVPGHEDFVKNMVAGVGSVDVALFVVAADDGWMPQTEEHLEILAYLGVTRAVVALTKIDLTDDEPTAVDAVRARLHGSPFADAPIIPTSIITGQGVDALKTALARVLADAPPPRDAGKPRLPIDRVFVLRGVGTIVTGTLTGGALRRGQAVAVQPSGRAGHIRTVQNYGRETDASPPGTRTALNVPDLAATGDAAIGRGEVVTLPALGVATSALDVLLLRDARTGPADPKSQSSNPKSAANRPLKDGARVRVHHGSGHWAARVSLLDRGPLAPGGRAVARLRFEQPIFAFTGDRLIVRDGAGRATVAGGIVLDPDAGSRRRFRREEQRRFLERLAAAAPDDAQAAATAWLGRDRAIRQSALLLKSRFSAAEINAAVMQLSLDSIAAPAGEFVVDCPWWKSVRVHAAELIDARHREHPERIGLPLSQLRAGVGGDLPATEIFDALVADLNARGEFIRAGTEIRRATHQPALPEHLRAAADRLRAALAAKPFAPPSRKELASDMVSQQALRFLCDTGEALELGDEIILLEESFRRMRTIITRFIRSAGPATASDLRQMLGTTRRVLIPVLEQLDREGVTRREGDRRALR